MTERDHVVQFLVEKIDEIKKEHVADLMRANRLDELNTIAEELDLSVLLDFVEESYYLNLSPEELPEDSLLELVFILNQTSLSDDDVFLDWIVFRDALAKTRKSLEYQIAELMDNWNIGDLTLEEILTGEIEDWDEDDLNKDDDENDDN